MIDKWLEQVLLLEKTKAEMSAQDIMRQKLDKQILYYAPIGATLDRKSRHIGFIEGNYMEMLRALNAARLRQRNLQMSTATLRVLNPPMFPMNAQPTNRLMILLGAIVGICPDIPLYCALLLRRRIARPYTTRPNAFGAYYQDSCHGMLPEGE